MPAMGWHFVYIVARDAGESSGTVPMESARSEVKAAWSFASAFASLPHSRYLRSIASVVKEKKFSSILDDAAASLLQARLFSWQ